MMDGVGAVGMVWGPKVPYLFHLPQPDRRQPECLEGATFGPALLTESRERARATPRGRGLGALRARSERG
jgi:hypothetical protein